MPKLNHHHLLPNILPDTKKVGLLGGSFDPAHYGHLYISQQAQRIFQLDQIFWLVTAQNPLKQNAPQHSLSARVEKAQSFIARLTRQDVCDARILAINLENKINSVYTSDILRFLTQSYPDIHFFWLMGADNLEQLPEWRNWADIFSLATVAVFQRGEIVFEPDKLAVSRKFPDYHVIHDSDITPPATLSLIDTKLNLQGDANVYKPWYFVNIAAQRISSTEIRDQARLLKD